MSTFIVCRRETLRVRAADIAQGRRAMRRLGTAPFDDHQVEKALYFARALPAALDVLADPRALAGGRRLLPTACQPPRAGPSPLLAVAMHEVGTGLILVRFGPREDQATPPREPDRIEAACRFLLEARPDDDATVVVKRFSVGTTH